MMAPDFLLEVKRKIFHSLSLLYVLLYWVMGRNVSLWVLGSAFVLTESESGWQFHYKYHTRR